jgi:Global regulator protein family
MRDHALRVGDELVIDGRIRLTILAVEEDSVSFGIAAAEPGGVSGPVARRRRPRMAAVPGPLPSDN